MGPDSGVLGVLGLDSGIPGSLGLGSGVSEGLELEFPGKGHLGELDIHVPKFLDSVNS